MENEINFKYIFKTEKVRVNGRIFIKFLPSLDSKAPENFHFEKISHQKLWLFAWRTPSAMNDEHWIDVRSGKTSYEVDLKSRDANGNFNKNQLLYPPLLHFTNYPGECKLASFPPPPERLHYALSREISRSSRVLCHQEAFFNPRGGRREIWSFTVRRFHASLYEIFFLSFFFAMRAGKLRENFAFQVIMWMKIFRLFSIVWFHFKSFIAEAKITPYPAYCWLN